MWFKHDRDFLKRLWPTKAPHLRQQLSWLAMLAWEEQGLVKDLTYLSWLSGITAETLETIWPDFESVSELRKDRWMPAEMWAALDEYEAKVEQAKRAGKTSAERRLNVKPNDRSTTAQRPLNDRSTDKIRVEKKRTRHSVTTVTGADALENPPTPPVASPSVEFKTAVVSAFQQAMEQLGADLPPYQATAADVIQVEALRKRCLKGKDGVPWELTPQKLDKALANYRASPIGVRTLADFAVKFSTFYQHALDQFGKPVGEVKNGHNGNNGTYRSAAERDAATLRQRDYAAIDQLEALSESGRTTD